METAKFWNDRQSEMTNAIAGDKAHYSNRSVKLNSLIGKLNTMSAEYFTDAERSAVQAEIDSIKAERDAEWTVETTTARRAEWNAAVKAGKFTRNGKIDMMLVRKAEQAQGWTTDSLKAAIARLGL